MIPISLSQIAQLCDGELLGADMTISAVSTDTRTLPENALFVALKGERFDAHHFIEQALTAHASAVLVEKISDEAKTRNIPQVVVKSTRIGLGKIAQRIKQLANVKTAAVTGSCGKTTVKELLASICQTAGKTLATEGNLNNDIGVPLTLLNLTEAHEYAVIELGANHIGEIAYTVNLTEPDAALVNNVQGAHLEGFGSLSGVAQAKGEIYSGLKPEGIAVVNLDCPYLSRWQGSLHKLEMISFSISTPHADVFASDIVFDNVQCSQFNLVYQAQTYPIHLSLSGEHNVSNALAAATLALSIGVPIQHVVEGLNKELEIKGRLNRINVNDNLLIIDDTYNANKASMQAALDVLSEIPGHKIFVMGDMAELGDFARKEHQKVGEYAREKGISDLYTFGHFSLQAQIAKQYKQHFSDLDKLQQALISNLTDEKTVILVKGSRSAQMERVVERIIAEVSKC